MDNKINKMLLGLSIAAIGVVGRSAFADSLLNELQKQADFWQQRGRQDLAAETWKKVLLSQPDQTGALLELGLLAAQTGQEAQARTYLQTLKRAHPGDPGIHRLEAAIQIGKVDVNRVLARARHLAQEGKNEAAIKCYQQVWPTDRLTGDNALEYYTVLSGTKDGWAPARAGLENLVRQQPQVAKYQLALAKLLTYRPVTRAQGMRLLAEMTQNKETANEARRLLQQAQQWQTAQQGASATASTPSATMQGYRLLDAGQLNRAAQAFESTLKKTSTDAEALAGLGIVRLRQQRFQDARTLLEQAIRQAPAKRGQWAKALRSAIVWDNLHRAEAARAAGHPGEADSLLQMAAKTDPHEPAVRLALASNEAARGQLAAAEAAYRQVLTQAPGNSEALRGLAEVVALQGRSEEAERIAAQLPSAARAKASDLKHAQAEIFRQQAARAMQSGDDQTALQKLDNAMLVEPNNPWARLDLAKLYQRHGEMPMAKSLIDDLLVSSGDHPDVAYASALFKEETGDWLGGLLALEKVPTNARTATMHVLQRRLWVHAQTQRAIALAQQGNRAAASQALLVAQAAVQGHPDLTGVVIDAWQQIGDDLHAIALIRSLIASAGAPSAALRIQYAGLLLKTHQDAELWPLLSALQQDTTLSAQDRQGLDKIRLGFLIRQSELYRQQGQLAQAYNVLMPALAEHPNDVQLQLTLARLYSTAGDGDQAYSIDRAVLAQDPQNLEARMAAVNAARQQGKLKDGLVLLAEGLRLQPENDELLKLAGQMEHAAGDDRQAIAYYRKALAIEQQATLPINGAMPLPAYNSGLNPVTASLLQHANAGISTLSAPSTTYPTVLPPLGATAPTAGESRLPSLAAYTPAADTSGLIPLLPVSKTDRASQDAGVMQVAGGTVSTLAPPLLYPPPLVNPAAPSVQAQINDIQASHSGDVAGGMTIRSHSGEAGLSQLLQVETPIEGSVPVGYNGKIKVRAEPVSLDAGQLSTLDSSAAARFGTNSLGGAAATSSQTASGLGVDVSYNTDQTRIDIGATPVGFPIVNALGGIKWTAQAGNGKVDMELSRRPVVDSLLSYAGTKDERTGTTWGGVTTNGGHLDATFGDSRSGVYVNGGYHYLTGDNVAPNRELDAGAGVYWKPYQTPTDALTVGGNLTTLFYKKNLRYFSLGQGGYFSPQSFLSMTVPVDWSSQNGRFSYRLGGALGLQTFREDESAVFPNNADLQNQLEQRARTDSTTSAFYPGRTVTSASYNFYGNAEYRVSPRLYVGGLLRFDNARDYNEQLGMIYARYVFEPQPASQPFQLKPLAPLFVGGPQ